MIIHLQDDRAASAAVAAIRPAGSHIFFPVKGDNAVAAVALSMKDVAMLHLAIPQISLSNLNYSSEKSAVRQEEKGYYERSVTRKPSTLLPESV